MALTLSNIQLWNYLRKTNPNFKSHTAEGTKDLFTERGFEAIKQSDTDTLNEFFKLSMRVAFQKIDVSKAKNPLGDAGIVQTYDTPNGGFVQRMAVNSIKPVTPAFKNLQDGDSVDPYIVRKPEQAERFFQQNFDYQSFITLQDFQIKTAFINEYGMSALIAGIMNGLMNGYTLQEYVNTLEALNTAINSTDYALQDSQKVTISTWTDADNPDTDSLEELVLKCKDIATQMEVTAQTSQLNALKFATTYSPSDFVLLLRAGIKNRIQMALITGAYNPETLTIPFTIKEVENFGGLTPYESDGTTALQEVYDRFGTVVGYINATATINQPARKRSNGKYEVNITIGGNTAWTDTYDEDSIVWDDPNEDVIGVIAQKGIIFKNIQNGLETRPIMNPRGLYTNFWVSSPNNAIVVDPLYAMILLKKGSE